MPAEKQGHIGRDAYSEIGFDYKINGERKPVNLDAKYVDGDQEFKHRHFAISTGVMI